MTWFKNATVYRATFPVQTLDAFADALGTRRFTACGPSDKESSGWVPVNPQARLVYATSATTALLMRLRTEKKLLPASTVKRAVREKAEEIEREQGYKPGRKHMREIKEDVIDALMPRAFTTERDTLVWMDNGSNLLIIDSASPGRCEDVLHMLNASMEGIVLEHLHVATPPAIAMTNWLALDEAPANFTIDQDTEMQSGGEGRATVRYLRQSVDVVDARRHIEDGKQCTRLAMTWADRISFVLTESLALKRIEALDVLTEAPTGEPLDDAERFDADFVLMTGELRGLIHGLVDALGGSK